MKSGRVAKLIGAFLLVSVLVSCRDYNEYNAPTSEYGTGTYHCYSQNVQTGQLYKAELLDKKNLSLLRNVRVWSQ
jgi:hypothetical protein